MLRWKKPSELGVNTKPALPYSPTSHDYMGRKVVAEGLEVGEAHVNRHVELVFFLGASNGFSNTICTAIRRPTRRPTRIVTLTEKLRCRRSSTVRRSTVHPPCRSRDPIHTEGAAGRPGAPCFPRTKSPPTNPPFGPIRLTSRGAPPGSDNCSPSADHRHRVRHARKKDGRKDGGEDGGQLLCHHHHYSGWYSGGGRSHC